MSLFIGQNPQCQRKPSLFILNQNSALYNFSNLIKIKEMNFSFSVQPMYHNMTYQTYSNPTVNPHQEANALLKLITLALNASLSAYSKFNSVSTEGKSKQTENVSHTQAKKHFDVIQISESNCQEKRLNLIQEEKIEEPFKEDFNAKAETEEGQKNSQENMPLSSSISLPENKILPLKEKFGEIEVEEWQQQIKCPQLGMTSSCIQKKKWSLLHRQVTDWEVDAKTGKKKKFSDVKSREMRMLFN